MATAQVDFKALIGKGIGFCSGGEHPDPPLDDYPLLAWTKDHPKFGKMVVHLEDQRASVEQIALRFATNPSIDIVASIFQTSLEHVEQALRYAIASSTARSRS
jgi:hypothetical protein